MPAPARLFLSWSVLSGCRTCSHRPSPWDGSAHPVHLSGDGHGTIPAAITFCNTIYHRRKNKNKRHKNGEIILALEEKRLMSFKKSVSRFSLWRRSKPQNLSSEVTCVPHLLVETQPGMCLFLAYRMGPLTTGCLQQA